MKPEVRDEGAEARWLVVTAGGCEERALRSS